MKSPEAPLRKRFVLNGRSAQIDPTQDVVRGDLADVGLADRVFAPHYAKAMTYRAIVALAVHSKPDEDASIVDTLAEGETLDLFDLSAGWGWVRTNKGVGYTRADQIVPL